MCVCVCVHVCVCVCVCFKSIAIEAVFTKKEMLIFFKIILLTFKTFILSLKLLFDMG